MKKIKFKKWHIGLIIFIGLVFYLWYQMVSSQFLGDKKNFKINKGDSFLEVTNKLKSNGVIKNRFSFTVLALLNGARGNIKAGQYIFEPGLTLRQTISQILNGKSLQNEVIMVIPEGFKMAEIIERVASADFENPVNLGKVKSSNWQSRYLWLNEVNAKYNTLEGFMFPDTYRFLRDATADNIINKILNNFDAKTAELRDSKIFAKKSFYDVLILASILEKEVPPEDMPMAAGVLWKRLELGMPMQVDATLVYALGRPIKKSDTTNLDSPYNTYKYKGLPPTPISNPGLTALKSAAYPQKSQYLFYLSRDHDGATVFSETLEKHNIAKAKYLGK